MNHLESCFRIIFWSSNTRNNPIIFWLKCQTLTLAFNNKCQRRSLNTTSRARIAQTAKACGGQVTGQYRTPNEVDILPGLTCCSQVVIKIHQVIEGGLNLCLSKGRIACTKYCQMRINRENLCQCIRANKLSLAVKVCTNNDRLCLLSKVLEGANNFFFCRLFIYRSPNQIGQAGDFPALKVNAICHKRLALNLIRRTLKAIWNICRKVLPFCSFSVPALFLVKLESQRKIRLENMTAKTNSNMVFSATSKTINRSVVYLVCLRLTRFRQKASNLLRCVVFLGNN